MPHMVFRQYVLYGQVSCRKHDKRNTGIAHIYKGTNKRVAAFTIRNKAVANLETALFIIPKQGILVDEYLELYCGGIPASR